MKPSFALCSCLIVLSMFANVNLGQAAEVPDASSDQGAAAHLARLNKKAQGQIQSRQFEAAKDTLLEALVLAKDSGLAESPLMVRTYVELAGLYLSAEKNRDKAAHQLALALKVDPDFTLPTDLETPALRSAYLLARREAGVTSSPASKPTAKPSEPAPPVEPADHEQKETPAPAAASEPATVTKRGRGGHKVTVTVADPDPPAHVPAALFCPLPFEIPPDEDMVVRCLTEKQQKKSTAVLYYRPEGAASEEFVRVPMNRSPKGWMQATIPADAISGKSLSYYIEARVPSKDGGTQILNLARPESPNSFLIKEGADSSFNPDRENILDTLNVTMADEDDSFRYHRRGPGAIWFSLAAGTGGAYHGSEAVDTGDTYQGSSAPVHASAGFTGATLGQAELEIGYQWTKRWSVSAMARYQYAPPDSSGYTGTAIRTWALAGYLRARYAFLTAGNFQVHGSVGAGGGTNFLVVVSKQCDANNRTAACNLTHSDTLHGGAFGILLGLGASYHLSRNLAVFLDINEIGTLPKLMALTEINLGFAIAFGSESKAAPTTDDDVVVDKPAGVDEPGAAPSE